MKTYSSKILKQSDSKRRQRSRSVNLPRACRATEWLHDSFEQVTEWPTVTTVAMARHPFEELFPAQVCGVLKRNPKFGILGYYKEFDTHYSYILGVVSFYPYFVDHALRFKRCLRFVNRPLKIVTRHFGRFGEYYVEREEQLEFHYSNSRRCRIVNNHVVASSLNGNNGEWTNTDDLAHRNGRGGNAALNAANMAHANHARPGQRRRRADPTLEVPQGAVCGLCYEPLLGHGPGRPLLNRRQGMSWSCGCWSCAECFAGILNDHIISVDRRVGVVACPNHPTEVTACKIDVLLNETQAVHLLHPDHPLPPYWAAPTWQLPPPPQPAAPVLRAWPMQQRWIYASAPRASPYPGNEGTIAAVVAGASVVCYFEPIMAVVGLASAGIYMGINLIRETCINQNRVREQATMNDINVHQSHAQELLRDPYRDSLMQRLGYHYSSERVVYPVQGRKVLNRFIHMSYTTATYRQVLYRLQEEADAHVAEGGAEPDLEVLTNTALYVCQSMQLSEMKARANLIPRELGPLEEVRW